MPRPPSGPVHNLLFPGNRRSTYSAQERGIAMKTKQAEWQHLTERAKWFELPQQSIGLGAVLGLTVACLGLLVMFLQFYLQYRLEVFWWGLTAFLIGSGGFAYSERTQILRLQWRDKRDYLIEARGTSHRCMHLEGTLPTHLRDARQAHCAYFDRTFNKAPLCIYCESYSLAIAPAASPRPQSTEQPAPVPQA